jgi:hypothetical protein
MGPLRDGWLLIYEDQRSAPDDHLQGKLCLVMTADQRVLCRTVVRGRQPGGWDLLTATLEQELDVELVWAEPVTMILPYEPTADEAALLGTVS